MKDHTALSRNLVLGRLFYFLPWPVCCCKNKQKSVLSRSKFSYLANKVRAGFFIYESLAPSHEDDIKGLLWFYWNVAAD